MKRALLITTCGLLVACSSNEVGTNDTSGGFGGSPAANTSGASTTSGEAVASNVDTSGASTTSDGFASTSAGMVTTGNGTASTSDGMAATSDGFASTSGTDGATSTDGVTTGGCDSGPLDAPIPNCEPSPTPDTGDYHADCVERINQFRWECQCLPPLERWTEGEACADQHAQYDSEQNSAHAGFSDRICDNGGSAQNECPGWGSTTQIVDGCLQSMWDEGPGENFNRHGHYINMSNTNYGRVACGMYETPGGEIWAVQNFSR